MTTNKLRKQGLAVTLALTTLFGASACSNSATNAIENPPITDPISVVAPPVEPAVPPTTATTTPTPKVTAVAPTPIAIDPFARYETKSQTEARTTANELLATQPISRSALITALENEEYSTADATYAVDYVWYQQAVGDAQAYFADGTDNATKLYNLLIGDGFTDAQAKFGVTGVGLTYTQPTATPTVKPSTLPAPAPTRTQAPSTLPAIPPTQKPSTLPANPPVQTPSTLPAAPPVQTPSTLPAEPPVVDPTEPAATLPGNLATTPEPVAPAPVETLPGSIIKPSEPCDLSGDCAPDWWN